MRWSISLVPLATSSQGQVRLPRQGDPAVGRAGSGVNASLWLPVCCAADGPRSVFTLEGRVTERNGAEHKSKQARARARSGRCRNALSAAAARAGSDSVMRTSRILPMRSGQSGPEFRWARRRTTGTSRLALNPGQAQGQLFSARAFGLISKCSGNVWSSWPSVSRSRWRGRGIPAPPSKEQRG
jgi:hypothetical protein